MMLNRNWQRTVGPRAWTGRGAFSTTGGAIAVLLAGCDLGSGPAERVVGTFDLVDFDASALPFDEGPLVGGRPPSIGPCHFVVTDGALSLDPDRRTFAIHYSIRNSCTGGILSQPGVEGAFLADGRDLHFQASAGEFDGVVRSDGVILVEYFDRVLGFAGSGGLAPSAGGQFDLVGLVQGPIEGPWHGDEVDGGCPTGIDGGSLDIRPSAPGAVDGTFHLAYDLRASCTGEIRRSTDESGAYERIGDSLHVTGDVGPGIVHSFRGLIEGNEVVLYIQQDLIFHPSS
jgi:hypothetical protein